MYYTFTHKSSSETKVIQAVNVTAARSCLPDNWKIGIYVLEITQHDPRTTFHADNCRYKPL